MNPESQAITILLAFMLILWTWGFGFGLLRLTFLYIIPVVLVGWAIVAITIWIYDRIRKIYSQAE